MKTNEEFRLLVDLNNNLKSHRDELMQQLAAMTAERDAYMRDYGEEQDRKREVAQKLASSQQQVTLLRDVLEFIPASGSILGYAAEKKRTEALAATEQPK